LKTRPVFFDPWRRNVAGMLHARAAALLLVAAMVAAMVACGSSSSSSSSGGVEPEVDAGIPTTPVSCPARTPSKTDPYSIRAVIFDSKPGVPFAGAVIEVKKREDDSILATATADATGQAILAVPSGGKLLDIAIGAHAPAGITDHVPSRVEIQGGYIGVGVQLVVYSNDALQARAALAGVVWDTSKAVVQIGLSHCNDGTKGTPPIEAAAIGVSGGSKTSYAIGDAIFDPALRLTTAYGGGTDFNVTPGTVTLTTVKDGKSNTYATRVEPGINLFALFQP
jgi:hypothetical protein